MEYKLIESILNHSKADTWDEIRLVEIDTEATGGTDNMKSINWDLF